MDKRDMNRALEYARLIKEFVCGQFPEEFAKYNGNIWRNSLTAS